MGVECSYKDMQEQSPGVGQNIPPCLCDFLVARGLTHTKLSLPSLQQEELSLPAGEPVRASGSNENA